MVQPEILKWQAPADLREVDDVEVHLLTSQRDWMGAAWALASFITATGRSLPITVHDDGSLDAAAIDAMQRLLPRCRVIRRAEADQRLGDTLASMPNCRRYRGSHPLALKLIDTVALAETRRIILLDSDVLFFRNPVEILDWVDRGSDDCLFNPDFESAYSFSREEIRRFFGVEVFPRINTGISLIPRGAVDLEFCERCLARDEWDGREIAWKEQTLLAICASRRGNAGLLSEAYEVSFEPRMAPGAISRHYVGAIRPLFYAEGLLKLRGMLT